MASGNSSQLGRISPRKFSEKIALLNKKEKETNAKFEEIIKEVQETKTQQQHTSSATLQQKQQDTSCRSNVLDRNDSDGLTNVYESLIECVSQFEQEAENERHNNTVQYRQSPNTGRDTVSVAHQASGAHRLQLASPDGLPQLNQAATRPDSNTNNIDSQRYEDLTISSRPTSRADTSSLGPCSSYATNSTNSESCETAFRSRVVSFGSGPAYKQACSNNLSMGQQQKYSHVNQHLWSDVNQQNLYLSEPSSDRSKFKSCSDPALHVQQIQMGKLVEPNDLCAGILSQDRLQRMDFDEPQAFCEFSTDLPQCQQGTTVSDVTPCMNSAGNSELSNSNQVPSHISTNIPTGFVKNSEDSSTLTLNSYQYDHVAHLSTELPGIKICGTEDDSSYMSVDHNQFSGASCNEHGQRNEESFALGVSQSENVCQERDLSNDALSHSTGTVPITNIYEDPSYGSASQAHLHGYQDEPKVLGYQPMATNFHAGVSYQQEFTWQQSNMSNIHGNNLMSTSDCGLTNLNQNQACSMYADSIEQSNNIIRSHSHSNIEYLAKKPRAPSSSNHRRARLNQCNIVPFGVSVNQATQLGGHIDDLRTVDGTSTSPMNSSSNLNSSQSELNSPVSSITGSPLEIQGEHCANENSNESVSALSVNRAPQFKHTLQRDNIYSTQFSRSIGTVKQSSYSRSAYYIPLYDPVTRQTYAGQPIANCDGLNEAGHLQTRSAQNLDGYSVFNVMDGANYVKFSDKNS